MMRYLLFLSFLGLGLLTACGPATSERYDSEGRRIVAVWAHSGQPAERAVLESQVEAFHAHQDEIRIDLTIVPEGDYNAQIQAAAFSGDLPDMLALDGPFLYSYAWQRQIRPLDEFLPEELLADLLPSIIAQGTWNDNLYAVGTFDSGLGIYTRRSLLENVGIRIPENAREPWSLSEFREILTTLSAEHEHRILDLKINYRGEWFTYAFSPMIQSAGGDLIRRPEYDRASGVLDSEASVKAMSEVARWFAEGLVHANVDDQAFIEGQALLSLSGHWDYPRYKEAFGDDLIVLPLPDFGAGPVAAQGSWAWGISSASTAPEEAVNFMKFLLETEQILAMTEANGAVPARSSAIEKSPLYAPGGDLHLFVQQLENTALPRPRTPAYPVITSVFQDAFDRIRDGGDVEAILQRAAAEIDQDLADNRGYPVE
ncbi:MAG: sugar ABC transporter substrate-binding protein [Opitutales bacterium]|nr:sugar ABC transporter substrate-binding protein [Opitutales bacterium]